MHPSAQPPLPPDRSLLASAGRGDFAAFQELLVRYQSRVYALAWRIVRQREDAEDVTQQTFVSVIEHIDDFHGEESAAGWILRIAANHALKVLRKRRGLATMPWPDSPDDCYAEIPHPEFIARWAESPEKLAERSEVRQQIDQALNSLDDKYRCVFVLRDLEGLSVRDTAAALEITEPNVKVRLLRARLMLRELLTRAFGDPATRMFPGHAHD